MTIDWDGWWDSLEPVEENLCRSCQTSYDEHCERCGQCYCTGQCTHASEEQDTTDET